MNRFLILALLVVSSGFASAESVSSGKATVALQGSYSWIKIEGEAARSLYEAMKSPANNNQGEAGDDVYFKDGESYHCLMKKSYYACDISIQDPGQGSIRPN